MHTMSQTEGRPRSAEAKEDHSLVHVCALCVRALKGAAHVRLAYRISMNE